MHNTSTTRPPTTPKLTPQETRILKRIGDGMRRKEVATEMKLSPHTIDSYLRRIYTKLGARSQASAVLAAVRAGIIS